VVVLPCGAGKTVVAMGVMAAVGASTLILTTSVTAVRQWIAELRDKTLIPADLVGEYTGESKDVRAVTVATYQVLTHRSHATGEFTHLALFDQRNWGLIVYDEVHLLPAPLFQITATLQARRRLGLTATLVREDHREDDVFALIGPKKADVPWKVLEREGWIATATCTEVRVPLPEELRMPYAVAEQREKFRVASENPLKLDVVRTLLRKHAGELALVIGLYVDQLERLAREMNLPLITGTTPQKKRDVLFAAFRTGKLPALIVSKVANFAIDLPDASVAILLAFSCTCRYFCPSCHAERLAIWTQWLDTTLRAPVPHRQVQHHPDAAARLLSLPAPPARRDRAGGRPHRHGHHAHAHG